MFLTVWQSKYQTNFETINNAGMEGFMSAWKAYQERILNNLATGVKMTSADYGSFHLDDNVQIKTGVKKSELLSLNSAALKRRFGLAFEEALKNYFNQNTIKYEGKLNNFIARHVGDITQQAATFTKKSFIRSDLAFTTQKSIPQNMELNFFIADQEKTNVLTQQHIEKYLSENYLNQDKFTAGFSLKNYSENIAYTHSKVLMEKLNLELKELGYYSEEQAQEANDYMLYFLSKYIIEITSPTVGGLYTDNGLVWMDQLLKKSRYFFHLRYYKNNTMANRAKWQVNNTAIYLQDKNISSVRYTKWSSTDSKNFTMIVKDREY